MISVDLASSVCWRQMPTRKLIRGRGWGFFQTINQLGYILKKQSRLSMLFSKKLSQKLTMKS